MVLFYVRHIIKYAILFSVCFLILNALTFSSTEKKKKDTSKKYFMEEQGRARGKIISEQVYLVITKVKIVWIYKGTTINKVTF